MAPSSRADKCWRSIALLALAIAFPSPASVRSSVNPRTAVFHRLSPEEGLSHSRVYSIAQDPTGFIWIGTEDGLDRYDGYEVKSFRHDANNRQSIANNDVSKIVFEDDGTAWIGTWGGGLDHFDPGTELFTHFPAKSLRDNRVQALSKDSRGMLWVGTFAGGLSSINIRTGQVTAFPHTSDRSSLSDNHVWSIAECPKGTLWVGTEHGLDLIDLQTRRFKSLAGVAASLERLQHALVRALFCDNEGVLWIGTEQGVDRFDPSRGVIRHYEHDDRDPMSLGNNVINRFLQDRSGTIWIATNGGGLNRWDREQDQFTRFVNDPSNEKSLSHDDVRTLYEDASGVLWIGTRGGGVNRLDLKPPKFVSYLHHANDPRSLSEGGVNAIAEDHLGALWIGTVRGLDRFDPESRTFVHYPDASYDTPSGPKREVTTIYEDRSGQMWLGFFRGGLCRFDRQTGKCSRRYRADPARAGALSDDTVNSILEDRSGTFWVGTLRGLNRFGREKEVFESYPKRSSPLSDDYIWTIHEDEEGRLWIGSDNGGLNRLDPRSGQIATFAQTPGVANTLSSNRVRAIFDDGKGTLWIGTANGLNELETRSGRIRTYFKENGLPSASIYGILGDDRGNLWLSTDDGVSKLDLSTRTFRNYTVSDGLQGKRFQQAAFRDRHGRIFFGGTNGFSVFDPDEIVENTRVPSVVLTAVRKFGAATILHSPLSRSGRLDFSYKDTFLTFEFAALDFTVPEENEYAYKLDGLDSQWIEAGTRHVANYSNLPPGRYVFRVKGSNSDHVWNENGLSIDVSVAPAMWQSWWFRLAAIGAIAAVAWLLLKARLRSLELQRRHRERTQFLANMSHELRTPLNAIIGFSEILRERLNGRVSEREMLFINNIAASGEHLLEIVNDILDLSKIEAGHVEMNPEVFSVDGSVDAACQLLRGVSAKRDITFEVDIQRDLPLLHGDPIKIKQILYNLLSNAVKFSPDHATVSITASTVPADRSPLREDSIQIAVVDRGVGIDPQHHAVIFEPFHQVDATLSRRFGGTGLGLAIVRRFIECHRGYVGVESSLGEGSTFTVTLPVKYRGAPRAESPSDAEPASNSSAQATPRAARRT